MKSRIVKYRKGTGQRWVQMLSDLQLSLTDRFVSIEFNSALHSSYEFEQGIGALGSIYAENNGQDNAFLV